MNTWKVILATLVIFVSGLVTGSLLVWHSATVFPWHPVRGQNNGRSGQPLSPGVMRLEFLRRIQRDLNLTPEQRERIDKILKQSQERTRQIMEPILPQVRAEFQLTRVQFREVLTAEQQARFDELLKHPQHRQPPLGWGHTNQPAAQTNAPSAQAPGRAVGPS